MSYKVLTLKDKTEWNNYLDRLPKDQQDVYFTPEYYSLYENNGDGEAMCFIYEENGQIVLYPFLKNSINKLGYVLDNDYFDIQGAYGYNGIVTTSDDTDLIHLFCDQFNFYCQETNIVAEFSRYHPLLLNKKYSNIDTIVIDDRKTISIDLSLSEDEIWKKEISTKNRNQIRKAKKNNLVFKADYEFKYINKFIELYNQTMSKLHADDYYYFSDDYYHTFIENLTTESFLGVILSEDQVIASAIFMYKGFYGHYHLSGSNPEYLQLCPNNLLLYEAAIELKKLGVHVFHIGGGTTADVHDSLYRFKHSFGKTENQFSIGKKIHNKMIYNTLCEQWEANFPDKSELFKNYFLRYRIK